MTDKAKLGDIITLQKQDVKVIKCEDCGALMVNIDADQISQGDLLTLKRKGVRLSNPETEDPICLKCEIVKRKTLREKLSDWFDSEDEDESIFYHPSIPTYHPTPTVSSPSIFSGSLSGGGFGGFHGGSFSGGGASRGF